jgi:hypothetical protein
MELVVRDGERHPTVFPDADGADLNGDLRVSNVRLGPDLATIVGRAGRSGGLLSHTGGKEYEQNW